MKHNYVKKLTVSEQSAIQKRLFFEKSPVFIFLLSDFCTLFAENGLFATRPPSGRYSLVCQHICYIQIYSCNAWIVIIAAFPLIEVERPWRKKRVRKELQDFDHLKDLRTEKIYIVLARLHCRILCLMTPFLYLNLSRCSQADRRQGWEKKKLFKDLLPTLTFFMSCILFVVRSIKTQILFIILPLSFFLSPGYNCVAFSRHFLHTLFVCFLFVTTQKEFFFCLWNQWIFYIIKCPFFQSNWGRTISSSASLGGGIKKASIIFHF